MEYSDLTAVTFWQELQRNLNECQRYYREAHDWNCKVTRRKMTGYGVELAQAEKEIESLTELGNAHSNAMQKQWKRYEEFKQYVHEKLPNEFSKLPIANCDDLTKIEPRKVAIAIESILKAGIDTPKVLLGHDATILEAMLRMEATSDSIATAEEILSFAKLDMGGKRIFDRLKKYEYVASVSRGYYLTESGIDRAKKITGAP